MSLNLAKVLSEHLIKQHQIEVEHEGEEEGEEVRGTYPLPRKRGRPRGPGRKSKKPRRENSGGKDLQIESTKQSDSGENIQDQDLGREEMQQQDSLLGKGNNQSGETSSSAQQLPPRKRL